MKDSHFLSNILSETALSALDAVAQAPATPFSEMVRIAQLDRARDFRNSDLCDVDLSYSDLRGFDLTGSDLSGAVGSHVRWDQSTILAGANIRDSIFASKVRLNDFFAGDERANSILKSVARADWAGQIIRSGENLLKTGRYRDVAMQVTEALFHRADDGFVKAELLSYLAPRVESKTALRELLFAVLSDEVSASIVVRASISLFRRHGMSGDDTVRRIVLSLINSPDNGTRAEAVSFIMRNRPTAAERSEIMGKAKTGDEYFGILFVAETARMLGDAYDLVTRDPVSNATFPLNYEITPKTRDLISRRWLRLEGDGSADSNVSLARRSVKLKNVFFDKAEIRTRADDVERMWSELALHGVVFRFNPGVADI